MTEGEIAIEVDESSVNASAFDTTAGLPYIKVFNRDFVAENVFSSAGPITPILFLGKESKEKQEEVERLRKTLYAPGGLVESQRRAIADTARTKRELDAYCVGQGTRIRELLRSSGTNVYNSYDKSSYRRAIEKLKVEGAAATEAKRLSEAQKDELKTKKDALPRTIVEEVTLRIPDLTDDRNNVDELLGRGIVSTVLKELEANPNLELWVRTGLSLHGIPSTAESPHSPNCGFCAQPLTAARVRQLEEHFSEQYKRLAADIEAASAALMDIKSALDIARLPRKSELYDHLADKFESEREILSQEIGKATTYIDALEKALDEKRRNLLKPVSTSTFCSGIELSSQKRADTASAHIVELLRLHDKESKGFEEMVLAARRTLEDALLVDSLVDYEARKSAAETAREGEKAITDSIAAAQSKIAELELELVEHHRAADELNDELKRYLGRDELKFKSEGTGRDYPSWSAGRPSK
jgi:wobble nucleotide-excising tRNase